MRFAVASNKRLPGVFFTPSKASSCLFEAVCSLLLFNDPIGRPFFLRASPGPATALLRLPKIRVQFLFIDPCVFSEFPVFVGLSVLLPFSSRFLLNVKAVDCIEAFVEACVEACVKAYVEACVEAGVEACVDGVDSIDVVNCVEIDELFRTISTVSLRRI